MNNQVSKDLDHLKILSICFYVLSGLTLFPVIFGLFYMVMGIFFGVALSNAPRSADGPPPALFGGFFVVLRRFLSSFCRFAACCLLSEKKF